MIAEKLVLIGKVVFGIMAITACCLLLAYGIHTIVESIQNL